MLIQIVIVLIVVGLLLWLVETQLPIDATFKTIIRVVVVIAVVLWLLGAFGIVNLPTGGMRYRSGLNSIVYAAESHKDSAGHEARQAGRDIGHGSREAVHDIRQDHPVDAGKDFGKGVGRGSRDIGRGARVTVQPEYGRHVPDADYRAHYGEQHRFRVGRSQFYGNGYRFQYSGFMFGYREWPVGWSYDDDCYIVEDRGFYWLYNVRYPGTRLILVVR